MKTRNHFRFLALTAFFLCTTSYIQPAQAALYGQKIVAAEKPDRVLEDALNDLQNTLQKMTGQTFTRVLPTEKAEPAITVIKTDSPLAPAAGVLRLKDKGREPFLIQGDGKNLLLLANNDLGLSHAIYFYLDALGCRWYFPGENWTIIPQRADIAWQGYKLIAPDFKMRSMFGTGGFGNLPFDRDFQVRDMWEDWQRRNRFGGEYKLGGHSGEAFNNRNKAVLLQHPEYLASVGGKHVPWSQSAKLNVANPDAVKLYVQDRVNEFRRNYEKNPDSPNSFAISVDPADGGGHCDSEECKAIGSVSDQVFHVANETAKAIRKEFPNGWVSLYAYNEHAAVPKIAIEPNVYVMVTPYAFNRTGLSALQLIEAWGNKVPQLSIRDYWAITDWSLDLPSFNYLRTPAEKLRLWKKNNIEGLVAESSYSAGGIGLGWVIGSRLMWETTQDENKILEEFYNQAFGPARVPMQRMLERWSRSFRLTGSELGKSFRDLDEAMQLAKDNAGVLARVDDYARYVQFLRLRYEMDMAPDKGTARDAAIEAYARHLNDIYFSGMVSSYRLNMLLFARMPANAVKEKYQLRYNDKGTGWQEAKTLDHAALQKITDEARLIYQPLEGDEAVNFEGVLTPVAQPQLDTTTWLPPLYFRGASFKFLAPANLKTVPIKIGLANTSRVTVTNDEGEVIFQENVEGREDFMENQSVVEIPTPAAGVYKISLAAQKFTVAPPAGLPFITDDFSTFFGAGLGRMYFWVPRGSKTAAFYFPFAQKQFPPRAFDPNGKPVEVELRDNGKIAVIPIAPGQDGKAWAIEGIASYGNASPQALNVPQAWAYSAETLLVPLDALTKTR